MFDLMITVPVRYDGLSRNAYLHVLRSDPMGICAGREVFGYTKKDTHYAFDERGDGSISGSVRRQASIPLADFGLFKPDAAAPIVRIVQGEEQPGGEIHVRRLPHPERLETAYSDIVYRRTPLLEYLGAAARTRVHDAARQRIRSDREELNPEILSPTSSVSDVYGGGCDVEDRRLIKRLTP